MLPSDSRATTQIPPFGSPDTASTDETRGGNARLARLTVWPASAYRARAGAAPVPLIATIARPPAVAPNAVTVPENGTGAAMPRAAGSTGWS